MCGLRYSRQGEVQTGSVASGRYDRKHSSKTVLQVSRDTDVMAKKSHSIWASGIACADTTEARCGDRIVPTSKPRPVAEANIHRLSHDGRRQGCDSARREATDSNLEACGGAAGQGLMKQTFHSRYLDCVLENPRCSAGSVRCEVSRPLKRAPLVSPAGLHLNRATQYRKQTVSRQRADSMPQENPRETSPRRNAGQPLSIVSARRVRRPAESTVG